MTVSDIHRHYTVTYRHSCYLGVSEVFVLSRMLEDLEALSVESVADVVRVSGAQ